MRLGQGPSIFILIPTDISIPFTIQVYDYSFINHFLEVGRGEEELVNCHTATNIKSLNNQIIIVHFLVFNK